MVPFILGLEFRFSGSNLRNAGAGQGGPWRPPRGEGPESDSKKKITSKIPHYYQYGPIMFVARF